AKAAVAAAPTDETIASRDPSVNAARSTTSISIVWRTTTSAAAAARIAPVKRAACHAAMSADAAKTASHCDWRADDGKREPARNVSGRAATRPSRTGATRSRRPLLRAYESYTATGMKA